MKIYTLWEILFKKGQRQDFFFSVIFFSFSQNLDFVIFRLDFRVCMMYVLLIMNYVTLALDRPGQDQNRLRTW